MAVDTTTLSGLDALEIAGRDKGPSRARQIWSSTWPKLGALAIALLIWQLVVWSEWKPEYALPGPLTVLQELIDRAETPQFWDGIATTGQRAVVGYALAVAIGSVVGLAVVRIKVLRAAIGSMITALQTMPSIAWFPLAVLLFQISEEAILFVVIFGAAPSIANGVISGVDYVPPVLLRAGRNIGARGISLYTRVIAPAALPAIIAGLKQGWAFAWRSLLAGEIIVIGLKSSVGGQLTFARELSDAPWVLAMMVVILIFGLVIDTIFTTIDKRIRSRYGVIDQAT
jgi:NitT/TauT family transport system permease protein